MDNNVISVEQNWRGRNFDENSCRKGKAVSLLNFNLRAVIGQWIEGEVRAEETGYVK